MDTAFILELAKYIFEEESRRFQEKYTKNGGKLGENLREKCEQKIENSDSVLGKFDKHFSDTSGGDGAGSNLLHYKSRC